MVELNGQEAPNPEVVIVGAGIAGLGCAGTLVLEGHDTLLIAETPEVGWNLRPVEVEGNRGYVQHPVWQISAGGGWWYNLAREIGADVTFHVAPPVDLTARGSGKIDKLPTCASATAMAGVFASLSPIPLDDVLPEFERVLATALAIPYDELTRMDQVPISTWLEEQEVNPILAHGILTFAANLCETTVDVAREHMSVFAVWGMTRSLMCGEGPLVNPEPDPWNGLAKPLAEAIERRGGIIQRSSKVARVLVEDGRATGVELADGGEVRANTVVLATGTSRVAKLLESPSAEVQAAIDHARELHGEDVCTYTVLGKPVSGIETYTAITGPDGSNLALLFPMHELAPAHCVPGKQFIAAQAFYTPEEYEAIGGREGAVEQLNELQEEMFPGFRGAAEAQHVQRHRHHWMTQFTHGPRLPERDPATDGLWFAGDGSRPIAGVAVEAAASAGVLRGRAIAAALRETKTAVATA